MSTPYVKFFRGTPEAFANAVKNNDTLYFISATDSDKGMLYLGEKLITDNINAIEDLEDILLSELSDGQLLTYDGEQSKWVNKSVIEAIGLMIGATENEQGANGLVPAPGAGMQDAFLRGDGNWVKIETSSGSDLTADEKSVSILDEVVTLKDFGIKYYKYVAETGSEENGDYVAAHYEAQLVDDTNPWKEGLEPKVVKENGEFVLGWFEPNSSTIEGITDQVLTLQDQVDDLIAEVDKKANAEDVYTSEEIDQKISEAVAAAEHLIRKTFATKELAEEFATSVGDKAGNYVYMVLDESSTDETNKYNEYLFVDGALELVGNWEVNLEDYATKEELAKKVDSITGKSLVDDTEIVKLSTVKENAEPNYITSVDETELKVDNGLLSIISITSGKVNGLDALLEDKADKTTVDNLSTKVGILETSLGEINTKVTDIEAQLNSFVTYETYNKDIAEIKDAITWKSI